MAVHTDSLLYAVTKSGLEAYTSRLYANLAQHVRGEGNQSSIEQNQYKGKYLISQNH